MKLIRYGVPIILAIVIVGGGSIAYFQSDSVAALIATMGFLYTISKPIQDDIDRKTSPKKSLRVESIYVKDESDFANEINAKIDSLTSKNKKILAINVLSTKRAVIQYEE